MQPLIDGDILRYEVGFMGEPRGEDGNKNILDFDRVAFLLDERIRIICEEVGATEEPILFLTADAKLASQLDKDLIRQGLEPNGYKPNFREAIAVTKGYKSTRKKDKPYHFRNITAHMLAEYNCHISNGIEADDSMCIEQHTREQWGPEDRPQTIICSRDKDLRMCPGWHYSWECGKQPSIGPVFVTYCDVGWLEKKPDGKVIGYGDKFFYYQMLVGDVVDTIPGCPGIGTKKAFPLLDSIDNKRDLYVAVRDLYQEKVGDGWETYMQEQANLLWMVREMKDGEPVMFVPPKGE